MCMEHSAGCMLFDLSYLVKDNWWKYANAVEYSQMKPGDQADVAEICKEIFAPEYFVTPEKLRSHLFEDPEFDMSTSVCMRDVENHVLIGFSGVKLSGNQQLYPDTAWISICGVAKRYQHCGYGTLLLQKLCSNCEKKEYIKFFWDRILQISFPEFRLRISRSVDFFKELDLHSTERIIMTWRKPDR